jgi:magnesium-transporting ATPase (P-type)
MADVPMMQEASVGMCVLGDKVNYTLPYADMVILKIGDLQQLMLWHGRGIAQRLVELAVMVILKGMVHTTCILSV